MHSLAQKAEAFQHNWLPKRPYATDDYGHGIYQMTRDQAISKSHIQANSTAQVNLLTLDIDQDDAVWGLVECNSIPPQYITENPRNGHVHAAWLIETPVTISEKGRTAPKKYLAAIHKGLETAFNGDPAYNGLIMKNPVSDVWDTYHSHPLTPYTLDTLRDELDNLGALPPKGWEKKAKRDKQLSGIGRNVELFNATRLEAYKLVAQYRDADNGAQKLRAHVQYLATDLNASMGFTAPLSTQEVAGIAKSISKWIISESGMWDGHSKRWLQKQNQLLGKANAVRSAQHSERLSIARMALSTEPGLTNKQLADKVGMSVGWVRKNKQYFC